MINDIFNILLPHICLISFIFLLLFLGAFLSPRYYKYSRLISLIGVVSTIVTLSTVQIEPQYFGFRNSIMSDSYTLLFSFVILVCGFFVILLTKDLIMTIKRSSYTVQVLILTSILGAMNVVNANDFLTLFVSLEIMGFSTYFLIASSKEIGRAHV